MQCFRWGNNFFRRLHRISFNLNPYTFFKNHSIYWWVPHENSWKSFLFNREPTETRRGTLFYLLSEMAQITTRLLFSTLIWWFSRHPKKIRSMFKKIIKWIYLFQRWCYLQRRLSCGPTCQHWRFPLPSCSKSSLPRWRRQLAVSACTVPDRQPALVRSLLCMSSWNPGLCRTLVSVG